MKCDQERNSLKTGKADQNWNSMKSGIFVQKQLHVQMYLKYMYINVCFLRFWFQIIRRQHHTFQKYHNKGNILSSTYNALQNWVQSLNSSRKDTDYNEPHCLLPFTNMK